MDCGNQMFLYYESLPFRCWFCHEYGHLLRHCPKVCKDANSPSSTPLLDKEEKGKAPMMVEPRGKDKEGFLLVKTKAKGCGQKRPFKDRQIDGSFNRFEVLENLALEEGVPHVVASNCVGVNMEFVPALELEPVQNIQEKQVAQVPLNNSIEDEIVLVDIVREVLVSSQNNKGSSHRLGVHHRPLKKSPADSSSKGQKIDLEKIKMTGHLLVESGFVKPLDAHFSQTPQ